MARRPHSLLGALFGAMIVMSVVVAVGRPNVFTDTRDYMIHGARFYQALRRTFLNEQPPVPTTPEEVAAFKKREWMKHFNHSNMGARSPYYGIFLYTLAHKGTLWLLASVQAFVCAWMLFLLWRAMAPAAPAWTYYTLMAALSAGTSLPWTAAFAVPDVFAGVLALAAALLLFYRPVLARWETIGVWLTATAAIAFHSSHLLLMLTLVALGLIVSWAMKASPASRKAFAGLALSAVAVAAGANALYAACIYWHTGDELRRPPFLAARVLADGPGRTYLRKSCAEGADWVLCRYKDTPLNDSDKILWSSRKADGVFNRSSYDMRLRMEDEEMSFVAAAVAHDPWGQFKASMRNWGLQLVRVWVDDALRKPSAFLKHKYWGQTNLVGLLRGAGECGRLGELCEPKVRITQLASVTEKVLIAALALLGLTLLTRQSLAGAVQRRSFAWKAPADRANAAVLFLGAAVILNAAVCGILSGPFPRYQTRIVWLLPAIAMLLPLALISAAAWARWAQQLKSRALASAETVWARIDPAFLRFGVVGATGFAVDAAILHVLVHGAGLHYFAGRLVSFSIAVLVTWFLNRTWTFKAAGEGGRLRQVAVYFGVQIAGGVANISVYTLAIMAAPVLERWLLIPLALGSAAGLCLTFLGAKHLAFAARRPAVPTTAAE